jgi:predicted alpha-1,2-mannosidase
MMRPAIALLAMAGVTGCWTPRPANPFDVDPFIGTGGGGPDKPITEGPGNTFPGAVVPWGMVSVSPHNDRSAPAGYRFGKPTLLGFGHVHLSGVGCPDLGNVLLAATVGDLDTSEGGHGSRYAHERAHPGSYEVDLTRFGIHAEVTATTHAGLSRFTFPADRGDANLIFDLGHALTPTTDAWVHVVSPTEIEGFTRSGGFCGMSNQHSVHFVARFSRPARATGTFRGSGPEVGAFARFDARRGAELVVAVGISYVSVANARLNLETEVGRTGFAAIRRAAEDAWTRELAKVQVSGGSASERRQFYTAHYHMLLHPNVFQDVNGEYVSMRQKGIRRAVGYIRYSVFSLWDTYRLEHPFLALVHPDRQLDMVRTMVEMARETGWLPKWELAGNETHVMVGDPAAVVIADTWLRGLRQFDVDAAWQAIERQASTGEENDIRPGNAAYLRYGYIPYDDPGRDWVFGTVSTTLEYALSDWIAGRLARALGKTSMADRLEARSLGYRRFFDPSHRLFRPRNRDGSWLQPFDPKALCCDQPWPESGGPGFVEGNAWQYTFFVPHDLTGLKALLGGDAGFVGQLQRVFDDRQFVVGNEPDMALPYLFTYVDGEAWRTQRLVRTLTREKFHEGPDGLPGNDDAGVLSAWFLFSALGIYPACPGSNQYQIGSPLFARATIALDPRFYRGTRFTIAADADSPEAVYIESMQLDGVPHRSFHIDHEQVTRGGTLRLKMTARPLRGS